MTHTTSSVFEVSGTITPNQEVDKFAIASLDDKGSYGQRPAVYASGDLYTFLTTTRESGGDFNFFDFFLPLNGGPPPHRHPFEDEVWHVTAGEFQFNLGSKGDISLVVPTGTTVFGPINRTHGYRNLNSTTSIVGITSGARTLSMTTPGALDLFFDAAAQRVIDIKNPIPAITDPTPEDFLNLILNSIDPNPPQEDTLLPYTLILPKDAQGEVVEEAKALAQLDGFKVWTTGDQEGIAKRPTFTGAFGINYTSLLNLNETGNKYSYNEFSLSSQYNNYPTPVVSDNNEILYIEKGQLSLKIGHEEKTVGPDTYVFIAPGNQYSIANKGQETVEALAITVLENESNRKNTIPSIGKDKIFPSPLKAQEAISPEKRIFLSKQSDYFNNFDHPKTYNLELDSSTEEFESRRRIYGCRGNDRIYAKKDDRVYGKNGNDIIDASEGHGGNQLYGGKGNDKIYVNINDRAFGGDGNDFIDASLGRGIPGLDSGGYNLLDGGDGNDILIAGSKSELRGGNGDDELYITNGGDNLLYGGAGRDKFYIVNGQLPESVKVEYSDFAKALLPPGLSFPELKDTNNVIEDFQLGIDKIYISGIKEIADSFEDLQLLPTFGKLDSTSIIANFTENEIQKEISLANVSGFYFNELTANDFVFL
jgi:Ca2+-binding RTX toxin-like protein